MKNKPLKVQPARKVYQPKYPSYLDKNPLLYPETRPYPFTHKFINWVSTGGLAGVMLFCGSDLSAQTKTDSLYNPFRMENANVPYVPVSFGTGMAERLSSEEAVKAIRKGFSDSGIALEDDAFVKDAGVLVNGYNSAEKLGFVYVDYSNMDETFVNDRHKLLKNNNSGFSLKKGIKRYEEYRKNDFNQFLQDKERYIRSNTSYKPKDYQKKYGKKLLALEPDKANEELFNQYYFEYRLAYDRLTIKKDTSLMSEAAKYIDNRFEDSLEKIALINFTYSIQRPRNSSDEYYSKIKEGFNSLKKIKSNKKFITQFTSFLKFVNYGNYHLSKDEKYQAMKIDIMNSFPTKEWINNTQRLDEYHNMMFVSMGEVREMERKSKAGTQFIAPVFLRDPMMIVPDSYSYPLPDSLAEVQRLLLKEYNERNGITEEFRANKKAETDELMKELIWKPNRTKQERDSMSTLRSEGLKKINEKYEAMELLSEEEKNEYKAKFRELNERTWKWQRENQEKIKQETLRKLEENVKIYIKWAKSQMGG